MQRNAWFALVVVPAIVLLHNASGAAAQDGFAVSTGPAAQAPATPTAEPGADLEKSLSLDLGQGVKIEFVLIPAGEFMMGQANGDVDEASHKVAITKPFYMAKYEVTQEQWKAVMGTDPSKFKGDKNPVDSVSWIDAQDFCKKLGEKLADRMLSFSLPTEAQWEYACRAGTTTKYYYGDKDGDFVDYGWCKRNSEGTTHPVGQKKPNAWGLYDMHGNVIEWCADWFGKDYYQASPPSDPTGPETGLQRTVRGGCWFSHPDGCRCTDRTHWSPNLRSPYSGFRVACSP
jgi:formylglycine-generating enzyme required for sulfatase activity